MGGLVVKIMAPIFILKHWSKSYAGGHVVFTEQQLVQSVFFKIYKMSSINLNIFDLLLKPDKYSS